MSNTETKNQIKKWLDEAYKQARNPDSLEAKREILKQERRKRRTREQRRFGF